MEGVLYPIEVPTLLSPWGWWSILFLLISVIWIYWVCNKKVIAHTEAEPIQSLDELFDEWKKEWTLLNDKKELLSLNQCTQQLYIVYASGLDMLVNHSVSTKSFEELSGLELQSIIEKKEKILFGKLYTPLFSQEGWMTKKESMMEEVYELIESRWIVLSADKQS